MSQSTTAAVRQNEMNVNITLLTTTTCAARVDRPAGWSCEATEAIKRPGTYIPKAEGGAWRLVMMAQKTARASRTVTVRDIHGLAETRAAHHSRERKCLSNRPG